MKLFPKILTVSTSVLLAAGSLAVAPIGANQSASAETIISQLGSDIDGAAANDNSGSSVSLSSDGTRVAIGAPYNDGTSSNAGHVKVYEYSGGTWNQLGSDIEGEAADDNSGYSVSLSSDGTRVAIGAYGNDGTDSDAGHVRVYEWNDGTSSWDKLGSDIEGEAADDYSGRSVSLSSDGTRVAIGAPFNDGNGNASGHVRVYEFSGGDWSQLGSDIDGEAADDNSGYSVSLSSDGTTVAIGAIYNDGTGSNAGHVRIYKLSGGTWSQLGSDIDGEAVNDYSGLSVSLSSDGTSVAIGAPYNDGSFSNAGHVRVHSMSTSSPGSAPAPAPYSGPIPTNYSDRTPSIGDDVIISGLRMNLVTSCTIDGVTAVMSNQSADSFTIVIPIGITSGLKDLVMTGPAGKLTAQGALTIQQSIPAIIDEAPLSSKLNAGSFNGYVAVYAKGHKGKTLSWKIAGKWFKTTITSDYQVFQRKTAAVGLDVDVHLYIDGEKQTTKKVRTR